MRTRQSPPEAHKRYEDKASVLPASTRMLQAAQPQRVMLGNEQHPGSFTGPKTPSAALQMRRLNTAWHWCASSSCLRHVLCQYAFTCLGASWSAECSQALNFLVAAISLPLASGCAADLSEPAGCACVCFLLCGECGPAPDVGPTRLLSMPMRQSRLTSLILLSNCHTAYSAMAGDKNPESAHES